MSDKSRLLGTVLMAAVLANGRVFGMATEQVGPDSAERPTVSQPGWPAGIVDLTRHPSRVYSIWVNGNETFYFDANTVATNDLLAAFGKARMRDHVVQIVKNVKPARSFQGQEFKYNVSLQIVAGIALFAAREGRANLPLEPRLTIVAGEDTGVLEKLVYPKDAIIECDIPEAKVSSNRTRPQRKVYYGRLVFADGSPTVEFVRNASRITLWEKDNKQGIGVAEVNNKGYFQIPLSEEELAALTEGKTWLTVSIGNWLTAAQSTDTRFPAEMLTLELDKAEALAVSGPTYYWGRILFEDGSGPVLNPGPWPGAEIMVDFPYAGSVNPDPEGYFKVALTKEQVELLSKQKARKNIYVPEEERGRATAKFTYPVSLLSIDKSSAGVVKIPVLNVIPEDCKPSYEGSGLKD